MTPDVFREQADFWQGVRIKSNQSLFSFSIRKQKITFYGVLETQDKILHDNIEILHELIPPDERARAKHMIQSLPKDDYELQIDSHYTIGINQERKIEDIKEGIPVRKHLYMNPFGYMEKTYTKMEKIAKETLLVSKHIPSYIFTTFFGKTAHQRMQIEYWIDGCPGLKRLIEEIREEGIKNQHEEDVGLFRTKDGCAIMERSFHGDHVIMYAA